ncbi:MAG: multidrug effflux MFS transporter [Pseudomonadota bacterium]
MRSSSYPSQPEFIALATLLMATVALSIDVMLPALGVMADEFDVTEGNQRQWVIVAVFVGLGVGQLGFGPLSDATGRRPAIVLGAVLFAAGAVICATAPSFELLIAGRVLQGFGAAGPRIVTVALIRDRFQGVAMARVMSIIMGVFISVPVFAPSVGQGLLLVMPWRGLFGILAALCVSGAVWLLVRHPETLAEKRSLNVKRITSAAGEVLADRRAMGFTGAAGLCYGALMGFIISSQQLFQEAYNVGAQYAVWFGVSAAFVGVATVTNAKLVNRFALDRICIVAVALLCLWSLVFVCIMRIAGDLPAIELFMLFNCPALFLLGLTFGNFNAIALERLGHIAGIAAAITASIQTLVSMVAASIVGLNFDMTPYPMFLGYVGFGVASLLLMAISSRHR